jgi:hypothetical protein
MMRRSSRATSVNAIRRRTSSARRVARVQGVVYVATGVWPLVDLRSFEAVTGPKVDGWLVKTVAGLLVTIGGVELWAARREDPSAEIGVLGAGTAATLGAVAAYNAARARIRRVYYGDAALEGAFVLAWAAAAVGSSRHRGDAPRRVNRSRTHRA